MITRISSNPTLPSQLEANAQVWQSVHSTAPSQNTAAAPKLKTGLMEWGGITPRRTNIRVKSVARLPPSECPYTEGYSMRGGHMSAGYVTLDRPNIIIIKRQHCAGASAPLDCHNQAATSFMEIHSRQTTVSLQLRFQLLKIINIMGLM